MTTDYELKQEQIDAFNTMPMDELRKVVQHTLTHGVTDLGGPENEAEVLLDIYRTRIAIQTARYILAEQVQQREHIRDHAETLPKHGFHYAGGVLERALEVIEDDGDDSTPDDTP